MSGVKCGAVLDDCGGDADQAAAELFRLKDEEERKRAEEGTVLLQLSHTDDVEKRIASF